MRPADFLDIAVIAFILYFALAWLKQKASRSVAVAIGVAAGLFILARQADMYLTSQLFSAGLTAVLVALVLIFHTDIRRIFERFATWKLLPSKHGLIASNNTIDMLTESVSKLAYDKTGALIVIRGLEPLERHIRGGILLSGKISSALVNGLFNTGSPTHDGAIIIEGEQIERFGVYLPLSQNLKEGGRAGTRHAAALGLSERCDAFILVVSEERGTISIADQGKLDRIDSAAGLKKRLQDFYQRIHPSQAGARRMKWLTKNLGIKFGAIFIAVALWWVFAYRITTIHRTYSVPVECRNLPADYILDDPGTAEARVSLSGPERTFSFDPLSMVMAVDLSAIREGSQDVPLAEQNLIGKPSALSVNQVLPRTIHLRAFRLIEIDLPVKVQISGQPATKGITCDPPAMRVLVPKSRRSDYTEIKTEVVNVKDIGKNGIKVNCLLPDRAQFSDGKQTTVIVKMN